MGPPVYHVHRAVNGWIVQVIGAGVADSYVSPCVGGALKLLETLMTEWEAQEAALHQAAEIDDGSPETA